MKEGESWNSYALSPSFLENLAEQLVVTENYQPWTSSVSKFVEWVYFR